MGKQIAGKDRLLKLRLLVLTGVAVVIALLMLVRYGRDPDTATLKILRNAVVSPAGTDSTFYMQMGESVFRSGHRIYPQLFFNEHQKFIYPPTSLFVTEGLDWIGTHGVSSERVWKVVLLLAWMGCIALGAVMYRLQQPHGSVVEPAAVVVLGILFLPFAEALFRGQVQILLTALWELSALLWIMRRKGSAGFVLALTCMVKPQLAIFVLWGVLRREWRFTAAFIVTCSVIIACSVAHFGLANHLDYFAVLSYLSRHGEALWANQSMNGLLNRLLRNGDPISWSYTVYPPYKPVVYIVSSCFSALLLFAGVFLPWFLGWARTIADFLLLGCVAVLMSPIAWEHHYGYFFLPAVLLLAASGRLPRAVWFLLSACVLAMANRWPPLDHRQRGLVSLGGDYLFFAGIVLCCLLCAYGSKITATEMEVPDGRG